MKFNYRQILSVLLIGTLLFAAQNAHSQQKPFKFGFKLAPGISWLSPDTKGYENTGSQFTFAWGFTADITLMEHYYFATGFNVSYFGGELSYLHGVNSDDLTSSILINGTLTRTYNQRYVEVPLAFKMKTNELVNNTMFFGIIGINTGILIRAKADENFITTDREFSHLSYSEEKIDIKEESAAFKASLVVGAGAEYVIDDSISLVFGLNFNNGLTNVLSGTNTIDNTLEHKAIPYYFELNLGVIF